MRTETTYTFVTANAANKRSALVSGIYTRFVTIYAESGKFKTKFKNQKDVAATLCAAGLTVDIGYA